MNPSVGNGIYPCITDVFLGTNIWLGAPVNKIEEFSEKKLLADCMSLIEPSDALISKLQDSIKRAFEDETITEDQYYLLKAKAFSNDYIMQNTLGDENYFTDKLTEELLEDIEKEIIQPYQNKIENLSDSLDKEKEMNKKVTSEMETMKANEAKRRQEEEQQEEKYEQRAENTLSNISTVVFSCIMIPIASTIVNVSGLIKIPLWGMKISIILVFALPTIGYVINKDGSRIKEYLKRWLIKRYKLSDYKKTL